MSTVASRWDNGADDSDDMLTLPESMRDMPGREDLDRWFEILEKERRTWFFRTWLPDAGCAFVSGPPKSGKSTFARALALSAMVGRGLMPSLTLEEPYSGSVVWLTFEESRADVLAGFKNAAHELGVTAVEFNRAIKDSLNLFVGAGCALLERSGSDGGWVQSDFCQQLIHCCAKEYPLVIIDSLRGAVLFDQASEATAGAFMGIVRELCAAGSTVLVLNHLTKSGSQPLGAGPFYSECDASWLIERSAGGFTLSSDAQRHGPNPPPVKFLLRAGGVVEAAIDHEGVESRVLEWLQANPLKLTLGGLRQGKGAAALACLAHADAPREAVVDIVATAMSRGQILEQSTKLVNGRTTRFLVAGGEQC